MIPWMTPKDENRNHQFQSEVFREEDKNSIFG